MVNGCAVFVAFVFAFTALVVALSTGSSIRRLQSQLQELRNALEALQKRFAALQTAFRQERTEPSTAQADTPAPGSAPPPAAVVSEPLVAPFVTEVPPIDAQAAFDSTQAAPTVEPVAEPVLTHEPEVAVPAAEIPAAAYEPLPPEPPPPPRTPPFQPPPPPPPKRFDWEGLVGVKLFSWIAGIALVLAAVFFLRYSVQQGWLSPIVRATIGLLTGATLIVVCEMRVARAYAFTANALHGAAIAILYATLFSTYALWHLLSPAIVFPLMIVVTAVAVLLSIRRDSVFIALLGLVGGFSTPALLSSGENRPIGLFSYLLLLNLGLALVGYRKRWPLLTGFSIVFTVIYEWGWIAKFLTPAQMPLAAGIFVVFAAVAATALWLGRADDEKQSAFDRSAALAAALPLLFGLYSAAVPEYGARYNLLFGFLLLIAAGLGAIAFTRGPRLLHAGGAATTLAVFAIWIVRSWTPAAWPGVLAWVAVFVVLYLAFEMRFESDAVLAAPLLFFMFPGLISVDATKGSPLLIFIVAFVLLGATAAIALWRQRGIVYYMAAFFTIVAETVWSAKYLNRDRLLQALAIYGIFALFFLGVPLLARRLHRRLGPSGALALLLLVSLAVLFFLTGDAIADTALWGLAILLAILNLGALIESRESSHPLLAAMAMILSWIIIAVWWGNATITDTLVPALMVVGAFSILVVAGNVWAARDSRNAGEFENGVYLAVVGHVFLMFVATQTALAIPPWPIFAVLAVLDLALGAAALYLRRARLMTAAAIASQVVLLIWCSAATGGNWTVVTLVACIAVGVLGVVWFAIDRRFTESATAALIGSYVVAITAGSTSTQPQFGSLLAAQVAITLLLLAVAGISELHILACVAAVATAFATQLAQTGTPSKFFAFGFVLYAAIVAYPMLLGARAKRAIEPYLAAVLASAWFFFVARNAMLRLDLGHIIGILPVSQAIVLMLLLVRLLRIETRGDRELGRAALVAGAALAFITAAVPLQLDKQWITIAWALEGAALVWLYRRIPHRGLLLWSAGLLAVVFVRLSLNPAVLAYHPPSHVAVLNWFLYTYLVCAAAMFIAARLAPRNIDYAQAALNAAGTTLLFLLLNIEIADFYSRGPSLTFNFFSSSLAQDLTYTIGWALFAIAMLIVGIITAARPARVAAVVLLLVTILKCFLHDLARLGGLYRVGSLLGLAASLVLAGILLQKYVMSKPKEDPSA